MHCLPKIVVQFVLLILVRRIAASYSHSDFLGKVRSYNHTGLGSCLDKLLDGISTRTMILYELNDLIETVLKDPAELGFDLVKERQFFERQFNSIEEQLRDIAKDDLLTDYEAFVFELVKFNLLSISTEFPKYQSYLYFIQSRINAVEQKAYQAQEEFVSEVLPALEAVISSRFPFVHLERSEEEREKAIEVASRYPYLFNASDLKELAKMFHKLESLEHDIQQTPLLSYLEAVTSYYIFNTFNTTKAYQYFQMKFHDIPEWCSGRSDLILQYSAWMNSCAEKFIATRDKLAKTLSTVREDVSKSYQSVIDLHTRLLRIVSDIEKLPINSFSINAESSQPTQQTHYYKTVS